MTMISNWRKGVKFVFLDYAKVSWGLSIKRKKKLPNLGLNLHSGISLLLSCCFPALSAINNNINRNVTRWWRKATQDNQPTKFAKVGECSRSNFQICRWLRKNNKCPFMGTTHLTSMAISSVSFHILRRLVDEMKWRRQIHSLVDTMSLLLLQRRCAEVAYLLPNEWMGGYWIDIRLDSTE